MKNPRHTLIALAMITMAILLAACGGKADSPTDVATSFLEALRKGDTGTATQLLTPEMRQYGSFITQAAAGDIPQDGKLHVTLINEVGNTATVRAEIDLSVDEAQKSATTVYSYYRNHRSAFKPLLNAEAYELLFETEFWTGFFDTTRITDRMPIHKGEALYEYLDTGPTTAALQRFLTNPPARDQTAIDAIEAIAASIDTESVQLDDVREQLRTPFAALGEYLMYAPYLEPVDGQVGISASRKTYYRLYELTLHKVDGKWLVAFE